ncbi:hypothetical protein PROFUN_09969 [Planoprotostelium fungivorum]|uniref:Uncharacterized protein n=1 Tax=Planoprotostelium fungivorum TaxID=1890364 RepID=A0A2P6NFI3_9EUKA|nr:hypothetical protein PROFUN_09969 [Planoprotostelium fungivorum]
MKSAKHVGSAILSWSKVLMLDFVYNCFYQHHDKTEVDLLYTDTDSIYMQARISKHETRFHVMRDDAEAIENWTAHTNNTSYVAKAPMTIAFSHSAQDNSSEHARGKLEWCGVPESIGARSQAISEQSIDHSFAFNCAAMYFIVEDIGHRPITRKRRDSDPTTKAEELLVPSRVKKLSPIKNIKDGLQTISSLQLLGSITSIFLRCSALQMTVYPAPSDQMAKRLKQEQERIKRRRTYTKRRVQSQAYLDRE